MTKLTKEQKFWEQCGFQQNKTNIGYPYWDYPNGQVSTGLLPIDLNNLFKYPRDRMSVELWRKIIREWASTLTGNYNEDTLVLFWAIYKAFGGEE